MRLLTIVVLSSLALAIGAVASCGTEPGGERGGSGGGASGPGGGAPGPGGGAPGPGGGAPGPGGGAPGPGGGALDGDGASWCTGYCECTACSDDAEVACVAWVTSSEEAADRLGCDAPWDDYFTCTAAAPCEGRGNACIPELRALASCADYQPLGDLQFDVCFLADDACGTPSDGLPCDEIDTCHARCILDLDTCDYDDEALYRCTEDCNTPS